MEETEEFFIEAEELFNIAEDALLKIEDGEPFLKEYQSIFRTFHSLKGAAGMLGYMDLQKHMHNLENNLTLTKEKGMLSSSQLNYFLKGIDFAKLIIKEGDSNEFKIKFALEDQGGEVSENIKTKEEPKIDDTINSHDEVMEAYKNIMDQHSDKTCSRAIDVKKVEYNIAIIDDEIDILDILDEYFSDQGFGVQIFSSFEEFKNIKNIHVIDIIITDFKMPDKNGIDVLNFVRSKSRFLPVLILSGYLTKEIILEALGEGVSGILEKPINLDNIFAQVKECAKRYKSIKLLDKSIDLMVYNFQHYDEYLLEKNKTDEREFIRAELKNILKLKKELFHLK